MDHIQRTVINTHLVQYAGSNMQYDYESVCLLYETGDTSFPEVQKMLKCVYNSIPLTGCTWHVMPLGAGLVFKNS